VKNPSSDIPSDLLISFIVPPNTMSETIANSITIPSIANGTSLKIVVFLTVSGLIIADTPSIRRIFAIFEPIMFPNAISADPLDEARIFTISSGIDEPNATIVRPIIRLDIPNFVAIELEPFTS